MIKAKRRVAWMMLQNASVVSLDENVLMLRFPRQGDVKGFTTGQYDEMLKQALQARYGVNLTVRAISGPDSGPGGGGPRRPAPITPPAPAPEPTSSPVSAPGREFGSGPVNGLAPAPQVQQPPAPESPASRRPAPPAAPAPAPSAPASPPPSDQSRDHRPFPSDDDFDPDDEDMSVPVSAELSGMALIQRELGAEIIGEYED
jgi:DNA polymerase-3 subunit gamma/tau